MEITKEDKRSVIDHCYLTYFISGMVILIFGVILPNLIEERNLSFTAAGGLLSFLAIGNLCSSLVYPVFCGMMSQKTAVVVLAVPYPVCLFLFTMGLPVPVLYVMIFLIGITKGMITIINNHAIRQVTGSSNQYLNLLHMWYAVGAFLSPFVTMLLMGAGMNWKTILRLPANAYCMANATLTPRRNIGTQLEVLEIHLGFHIGSLHAFDHSSLRTTYATS